MARFGQQFLANLGNAGGMLQGFSDLGGTVGGVPGQMRDKRILGEEADELKNSGFAPGTAGYLSIQAMQAARRGNKELATKYGALAQQEKNTAATLGLAQAKNTRAEAREGRDLITHQQGVLEHQQGVTEHEQAQVDRQQEILGNRAQSLAVIGDLQQAYKTKKNFAGEELSPNELKGVHRTLVNAARAGDSAHTLGEARDALLGKKEKDFYVINDAENNQVRFVDLNDGFPKLKAGESISKIPTQVNQKTFGVTGEEKQFDIAPAQFSGALKGVNIIAEATGVVDRARGALEGNVITTDMVEAEDTVGAYQILISTVKDVEAAFANNPRFAEGERKQISDLGLSKLAQSAFASESAIRSKLQASVDMFEGMRIREINFQNDPNTESGAKKESQNRAKTLSESISKIKGILQSGQQEAGQQQDGIPDNINRLVEMHASPGTSGG
tara:strand:+ start:668 stop:1999 length:1332 start_codon:yes stop_codon:yes gene_type:complete